ncbi:hypothetical protein, conserved [Babesia ovata]|uniref:6-Cys domain-containing protein n=1 Tax=Babesia ovata TaxID=189622 RepID=A0A2H6KI23_9APIC|nr:uncharacterized protein BOVATA_041390 [Babesia ovata]GBE62646.1 hypothetical protein, conserved [Babesia ovata]
MSKSPIGFLCEGRIEPQQCMKVLLDENGGVVTAPTPSYDRTSSVHWPWVVAAYSWELGLPPFNGECKCVDRETGEVKAKIEIRSKTDYICDIASRVFRDGYHPIRGPWCSVVLHPGSTLTIRVPTADVNSASIKEPSYEDLYMDIDEDVSSVTFSQLPSTYEFDTGFYPNDLTTLIQLASVHSFDIYDEICYDEALVGDALELDVSQMHRGEVKLTYHLGKPLALRDGENSFFYHWALKSRKENIPDNIRAMVQVSFAFTHSYQIVGCDNGAESVFDAAFNQKHCSVKSMANGIGDIYECIYRDMMDAKQAGIHCRPDEMLMPTNCESMGYDLQSNQVMPFPGSVRNSTLHPMMGFQVFYFGFRKSSSISYACICVDQRGYERSRLILESNRQVRYTYTVRQEEASDTLFPYLLMPLNEMGLSGQGLTSPMLLMLNNISKKDITIHVGTTLSINCENDVTPFLRFGESSYYSVLSTTIPTKWLPKQSNVFYYTIHQVPSGPEVVHKAYNDTIATTPGGFRVIYNENVSTTGYQRLIIEYRQGSILISKDLQHKKYVPMTFVCGKALQQFDLFVTGNEYTSDVFASTTSNIVRPSVLYTWHVVEVKIETTDPYMQGCGVTYESTDLFKPETPKLYDGVGQSQFGCKIDLQDAKEAAFYCPAPYVLDPPNCFGQVLVDGSITNLVDVSKSLRASRSNHFVILRFESSKLKLAETLRQTPPLECRCVTVKGIILSTIQIENYYAK